MKMSQILVIIAAAHLVFCPFTKVEESFNLQAMHDILYHRLNFSEYDHNEFPGVVPRTFIGPLFISILVSPIVSILQLLDISKFWSQYIVRAGLGLCVIASFNILCKTLEKTFRSRWLQWFIAITVTQSHFIFYLSRPLPNTFALPLVLLAVDSWINNKSKQFILYSGAAIIIFRFELALFLGLLLLYDLIYKRITIKRFFQVSVPSGILFLLLTVVIDSVFWNRPLWPEGEVLWYNTILDRSSDYGTSPFLWYFYSAIPRGMAASVFLVPIGLYFDERVRRIFIPSFLFVLLYSLLPHKELRFIIYIFPFFNIAAATACHRIWENRLKSPTFHLLSLGVCGHLAVNVMFTLFLLSVSTTNYPGGSAISHLHRLAKNENYVYVHIDNLAAQTGVSRFTQINTNWRYCKKENVTHGSAEMFEYTHLITEAKSRFSSNLKPYSNTHDIIDSIEAFHQIYFNYLTIPPIKIKTKPVLYILRRKDNYKDFLNDINFDSRYNEEEQGSSDSSESGKIKFTEDLKPSAAELDRLTEDLSKSIEESEEIHDNQIDRGIQTEQTLNAEEESSEQVPVELRRKPIDKVIRKSSLKIISKEEKVRKQELFKPKGLEPKPSFPSKEPIQKESTDEKQIDLDDAKAVVGTIKKSIRKIISKYRRTTGKSEDSNTSEVRDKSEDSNTSEVKDASSSRSGSIKKFIRNLKNSLQKEEIQKIENQVLEWIDSNPNLINKELIKEKIQKNVVKEILENLGSDDNDSEAQKSSKNSREMNVAKSAEKFLLYDNLRTKAVEVVEESDTQVDYPKENTVEEEVKPELDVTESEQTIQEVTTENAIDIYEEPAKKEESEPEESQPKEESEVTEDYEPVQHEHHHEPEFDIPISESEDENKDSEETAAKVNLEQRFKHAKEQISNIMSIIDEIVETIEITENESSESR